MTAVLMRHEIPILISLSKEIFRIVIVAIPKAIFCCQVLFYMNTTETPSRTLRALETRILSAAQEGLIIDSIM